MESIERLRIRAKGHYTMVDHKLLEIADAIEEEFKELRDQLETSERQKESYREDLLAANKLVDAAYNDGFDDGFASADDWLGQHEDAMAEHGWVKLPVDADGVPIHVGDEVEYVDEPDKPRTVAYLHLANDGWLVYINGVGLHSDKYRHHRAPTVEDVLRDFAEKVIDSQIPNVHPTYEEAIAEYVKRLRLAGDAE